MGYRRYRRKRSMASEALADTAYIANRLPWKGAVIFGVVLFVAFYWVLPAWINHQLASLQSNMFRPMLEAVFARRVHWVQWLGIAFALICTFFAIRNYLASQRLGAYGERNVSYFGRLLARWLD
jgi:hypothetical protein